MALRRPTAQELAAALDRARRELAELRERRPVDVEERERKLVAAIAALEREVERAE
jgi:hypothetical protein